MSTKKGQYILEDASGTIYARGSRDYCKDRMGKFMRGEYDTYLRVIPAKIKSSRFPRWAKKPRKKKTFLQKLFGF